MDIKQFRGNIQNMLCDFFVSHDDKETTDDIVELVEIQIAKAKNEGLELAINECEEMAKVSECAMLNKDSSDELKRKAESSYHSYKFVASRIRSLKQEVKNE